MNIVLIGYRCSGKTRVGEMLAKELGLDFLDTDVLIEEKAKCSIASIISKDGWHRFREMEREIIQELSRKDNLVIATGGGVVMDKDSMMSLNNTGAIVWLKTDAKVIRERMEKEQRTGVKRPSLTGTDPVDEINPVLTVRTPLYEQASDLVVDTTERSPCQVMNLILEGLSLR